MAFLFITKNFYSLVVLYEALKPITDFRSYLPVSVYAFVNKTLKVTRANVVLNEAVDAALIPP